MNKTINIKQHTSVESISEEWGVDSEDELVFVVSKSSSFALFAEGVALGYLQSYLSAGKRLYIQFHDSAQKIRLEDLQNASVGDYSDLINLNIPEILCSIFGLQLLYKSSGVNDALNGLDDPVLARKLIGSVIWKTVLHNKGRIGDGKNQYLISRHDYRIPALLRGKDSLSFPSSDVFRSKISPVIGAIGKEKISSVDAKTLVGSWVYHIAENAFEHGSVDLENNSEILDGYSGILIQKIATPNRNTIDGRGDLDTRTKEYLHNLYQNHKFTNSDTLTVITVMDRGRGIHNTLPKKYESHSDVERLGYAYKRGVTRHSIGEGRSGYGLFDSIRAARKLNACLVVSSGDIYSTKAFEELNGDSINFDGEVQRSNKTMGTSQTIVWPSSSRV